tara:strand:- start:30247 stop:30783 length:537 start_codon:yes stop_codon:yes gene_type:complete
MEIEILNSMGKYVQKSFVFLYPFLKLQVKPIETYLRFGNVDLPDEKLLICLFWTEDKDYIKHEKAIENSRYFDAKFKDDVFHIITFNLHTLAKEYDNIVAGSYSKCSKNFKTVISHINKDESIKKCLYPELNYKEFAEALDCDSELLKGKELLAAPLDSAEEIHVTKEIKKQIEDYYI